MTPPKKHDKAEIIRADKFNLIDTVSYQDDAIVSREIANINTGTINVFAFAKGQGLSEHTSPFDALVYVFDGEVELHISGKTHFLKDGEMIIIPANKPHALKALEKFKMMLIVLRS